MSRYAYVLSRTLIDQQLPFDAIVMAAMRKADTLNSEKLKAAFPELAAELQSRYDAPGGYLPGEEQPA